VRRSFSLLENPLVGRQMATHLTGGRLGVAFFLLTGTLLTADIITFSAVLMTHREGLVPDEAGRMLSGVNWLVLLGLLIIALPLRVAGAIDGPRMDRVFDQVVVTGVSPLRIQLGNWALAFIYALGILVVSLPFQAYAYMLGGVSLRDLALGYGTLALYSNLIIAVALGLGIVEREWVGVPVTIFVFAIAGLICVAPVPGVFGLTTPVRQFLRAFADVQPLLRYWGVDPIIYVWSVPAEVFAPVSWVLLAAPFLLPVLLGPSHRFLPGLNNFGNVVLPGDRKRRFFRKVRISLTRRVELAFFYENRPPWLSGLDYPLRSLLAIGAVLLALGIVVGLCFRGSPAVGHELSLSRDPAWAVSVLVTGAIVFLAVLLFGDSRSRRSWSERIGPWEVRRGLLQGACVLGILGAFLLLHRDLASRAVEGLLPNLSTAKSGAEQLAEFQQGHTELVLAASLFLLNGFLLGRLLATFIGSQVGLRFLLILAGGAVLCGPLIVAVGMEERWVPRDLFPVLFWTPFSVFLVHVSGRDGFGHFGPDDFKGEDAFRLFLQWHGGLALVLLLLLLAVAGAGAIRRRRSRPAMLLLGLLALPPGLPSQDGPFPLETKLVHGFDGQLFQEQFASSPDFFTLVLTSRSPTALNVDVRLELPDGSTLWSRPFVVPPGTAVPLRWTERRTSAGFGALAGSSVVVRAGLQEVRIPVQQPHYLQRNSPGESRFHLLVTERGGASAKIGRGEGEEWAVASASCLPEESSAYWPLDAVFLDAPDLSRWTHAQRRALHDYLRLGGTVVHFGAIDPGRLKGIDVWASLLPSRASYRASMGGVELAVEELEEAWVTASVEGVEGREGAVPLLSVRPVGLGRLCHSSVSPAGPHLDARVWEDLWTRALPRGDFPEGSFSPVAQDIDLRDSTSLFVVLVYFVAYSCVLGPFGFFALRRRSRRKWIPLWAAGLPVLFVALLPVLHASLHLRPSYASMTRVAVFGAGTTRGVVYAGLYVRSSGRQDHVLDLQGQSLGAFAPSESPWEGGRWRPTGTAGDLYLAPLPLSAGAGNSSFLGLRTAPWGSARIVLLGDVERERPASGRAVVSRRTNTLELSGADLDPALSNGAGFVLVRLSGDPRVSKAFPLQLDELGKGPVRIDYGSGAVPGRFAMETLRSTAELGQSLLSGLPERDGVFIGYEVQDAGLGVRTGDLAFEREIEDDGSKASKRLRERASTVERGGKLYRSLSRSAVLVELPLEVR